MKTFATHPASLMLALLLSLLAGCGGGSDPLPAGYVSQGGLTWMPVSGTKYAYADATALCAGTINGQTGWRLPTKDELVSLYNSGAMNGQGWTLGYAWSSTPVEPGIPGGSGSHYGVGLFNGLVGIVAPYTGAATAVSDVSCVR